MIFRWYMFDGYVFETLFIPKLWLRQLNNERDTGIRCDFCIALHMRKYEKPWQREPCPIANIALGLTLLGNS